MKRRCIKYPKKVNASVSLGLKQGGQVRKLRDALSNAFDALESCDAEVYDMIDGHAIMEDLSVALREVDQVLTGSVVDYSKPL